MHREDQCPEEGSQAQSGRVTDARTLGLLQETEKNEVEDESDEGVQQEAGEMIAGRIHAPDQVVEAEGHPGERYETAQIDRGEHPPELGKAESTI